MHAFHGRHERYDIDVFSFRRFLSPHNAYPLSFHLIADYFAMLDAAVRMQPMPAAYLTTKSNIYCQDCGKTGQVQYHFVGLKCADCGSYNTREMGRVDCSDELH